MPKKVLVISKRTDAEEQFIDRLNSLKEGLDFRLTSYDELTIEIETRPSIYLPDKTDIASFDLVYFKTSVQNLDMAAAVSNYLKNRQVKFIDQAVSDYRSTSKIYQYVILADLRLSVPHSIFMLNERLGQSFGYLKDSLGLPFILKDTLSNKGNLNYLINSRAYFKAVDLSLGQFVAQQYIPNDGDYRILVYGDQIKLVIKRRRADNSTHLNNVSLGGSSSKVAVNELPIEVRTQAIKSAQALNRQIVGVDFVKDSSDGKWYILEANDGPQISTGALKKDKSLALTEYFESLVLA